MGGGYMNSEVQMKQFLFRLAESFPANVSPAKLEIFHNFLRAHLAHVDLGKLYESLIMAHNFFPSMKEIMDALGARRQTRRELATEFVDSILTLCQGSGNVYEIAGSDNANFWKQVTGLTLGQTKTDLHSGNLETRYLRGQWIDRAENEYTKHDEDKKLKAAQSIAQITGEHDPEVTP
jgi:hypothetical protein